jgi:fructose-1,6-bisphosphatase II
MGYNLPNLTSVLLKYMSISQNNLPDRNLALELARATEAGALASARWLGKGNKIAADQSAVDAMRLVLNTIFMRGTVVIGEGEKDEAPMLYNSENLGNAWNVALDGEVNIPECDIAVDPVDGTTLTAHGKPGAISVIAASGKGTMFQPGSAVYMQKIAVGPEAKNLIDPYAPVKDNLKAVAKAFGDHIEDVTAIVLNRPRHDSLVKAIREAGARIQFIDDGDVEGAIATARQDSGANILFGTGGTPEGVIAACAMKSLGGALFGRLYARNEEEQKAIEAEGNDTETILTEHDLVKSDDVFFAATAISKGSFLEGVKYSGNGATTQSIVMRSKSGTIRVITSEHNWHKLTQY